MSKKHYHCLRMWAGLGAAILGITFNGIAQYTNGIYAEFNTSMGSFTCRLDYAQAPRTCTNFIGLASGERAWLDLPTGVVRTNPFYDGTTFHRVIAGFVDQGGSRNGLGKDGPGYQFTDEFTPALRHDGFGVLSMANNGPDSNGSQYFITTSAKPGLDDVHSVFGRLYGGSNVVYAINHVATDSNDKPLTNVVVNNVVIRRIGAAAQTFDIHAQGLPMVTNLSLEIAFAAGSVNVTYTNPVNCNAWLYLSTNLLNWFGSSHGHQTGASQMGGLVPSSLLPKQFFRAVQIQYPPTLFVPRTVHGKTLTFTFAAGNSVVVTFDYSGGATYTWTLGPGGTISLYNWVQDPYRGRLLPIIYGGGGIPPMDLHLGYASATSGTLKGTAYPNFPLTVGSFPVSGAFTSTP